MSQLHSSKPLGAQQHRAISDGCSTSEPVLHDSHLTCVRMLCSPACRRLVVRFTNRNVVCQVAYATMAGDKVMCAAYR